MRLDKDVSFKKYLNLPAKFCLQMAQIIANATWQQTTLFFARIIGFARLSTKGEQESHVLEDREREVRTEKSLIEWAEKQKLLNI